MNEPAVTENQTAAPVDAFEPADTPAAPAAADNMLDFDDDPLSATGVS